MTDLTGNVALVTGASGGIGAAIAVELARHKTRLALVGRDAGRLGEVAGRARTHTDDVRIYQADLVEPGDRASLKAAIDHDFGKLDILVHSAGVYCAGPVEEVPPDQFLLQLQVNTVAPYALTHFFLPVLRRRRGQIVFINSRAGLNASPGIAHYAASKHALRTLADALRREVGKDGVRIVSVYPGRIDTPMQRRIQEDAGRSYDPGVFPGAELVAEVVLQALTTPAVAEISDVTVGPQYYVQD